MKSYICRFVFTATALFLNYSQGILAQQFTATDFKAGRLEIPLSPSVQPNPSVKQSIITELNRFAQEDNASSDSEITIDQAIEKKTKRVNAMLQLITENPGAESSLTAVLVITKCCKSGQKELYSVILEALQRVRETHSTSWQAQVSGLLEARMTYFGGRQKSEKERLENAIRVLKSSCPEKEPVIDWTEAEIATACRFLKLPEPAPLRAAYLSMIAQYEYMMGYPGASLPSKFDYYWLTKARASFSTVTEQFPDTKYAREAKGFVDAIDDIVDRERKQGRLSTTNPK